MNRRPTTTTTPPRDLRPATPGSTGPPGGRRRLIWAMWLWAATAVTFLVLAFLAHWYDRFPGDERIAHAVQGIDVPALGGFFDFVNWLGEPWPAGVLIVALAAAFALRRAPLASLLVLLTIGPRIANSVIKDWVERPRPSPDLVKISHDASGFGFPSGHTVGDAALFAVLLVTVASLIPWRPGRRVAQGGCLLAIVSAGPARVYVGAHWPSDVLGGYLLALLFLLPILVGYRALRRASPR